MGTAIVCTMNQPTNELFLSFHNLLLLHQSRMVFFGPLGASGQELVTYFEGLKHVNPLGVGTNPVVWMMDLLHQDMDLSQEYLYSPQKRETYRNVTILCKGNTEVQKGLDAEQIQEIMGMDPISFESAYVHPFNVQFKTLLYREAMAQLRRPTQLFAVMTMSTVMAIFLGLVWLNQGCEVSNGSDFQSMIGGIYSVFFFGGLFNYFFRIPAYMKTRHLYQLETDAKTYAPEAYFLVTTLLEMPMIWIQSFFFTIFFYPLFAEKCYEAGPTMAFMLFYYLWIHAMIMFGQLVSVLYPRLELALEIGPSIIHVWSLFSGYVIRYSKLNEFWRILHYLCPLRWPLEGVTTVHSTVLDDVIQMTAEETSEGEVVVETAYEATHVLYEAYAYELRVAVDVAVLVLFLGFFRVLSTLSQTKNWRLTGETSYSIASLAFVTADRVTGVQQAVDEFLKDDDLSGTSGSDSDAEA
ncbi:hypothetical protein CYMTET_53458 [Cymbomonas tetramitiformis]|uniref:ABC-2 type transporter transmembrane domain-containing protein n=1 Tax=Cymbomonas tetramitiformis TaxID=36881 RepID=A0AAE0BI37_9CHLO|nr:hypothetical protein CYMTET_53458 [Cymbomonas tetramitiformis]